MMLTFTLVQVSVHSASSDASVQEARCQLRVLPHLLLEHQVDIHVHRASRGWHVREGCQGHVKRGHKFSLAFMDDIFETFVGTCVSASGQCKRRKGFPLSQPTVFPRLLAHSHARFLACHFCWSSIAVMSTSFVCSDVLMCDVSMRNFTRYLATSYSEFSEPVVGRAPAGWSQKVSF